MGVASNFKCPLSLRLRSALALPALPSDFALSTISTALVSYWAMVSCLWGHLMECKADTLIYLAMPLSSIVCQPNSLLTKLKIAKRGFFGALFLWVCNLWRVGFIGSM